MPNVFDGTNPITDILGDEPTEREVTMENQSTMTIIEPLTNTQIPAGQTVLVRVIGDIAHSTLVKNIQQINALQGFEVIGLTSVVIPDEPVAGDLLLVPTGAVESIDGEYQRFTYDGASTMIGSPSYVAELDPSDWQPNPTIKFKLPSLTQAGQSVALYLFNGDVADLSGETFTVNNLIITADLNGDAGAYQLTVDHLSGRASIDTTAIDPVPAAGTEITISIISRSSMLISFGSENIPVTLPTDFLATTLNIVLMSRASDTAVPPLSIQVTGVEVA